MHAKECVKSLARMWWEDLCTVLVMTHHASHRVHCIQYWICLSFPPFWRYLSWQRSCGFSSSVVQEWQTHRHSKRVVKPCCMTCKYSFPESTYFLWNCAFLFQMKGSTSSDWWGQSSCNKLVSYFTVQPLKRLVKCTSGSAAFLNNMCVFRGPMVWTCSFDGSGTIQRDLWFCSGIRVPTHSCSSVKRGKQEGVKCATPTPKTPLPQPRYDVSLFNLTHLRENEQDASRGVKQRALKQAGIVLCRPHAKSKGDGIQWSALQMNVSDHLSHAFPLFPPSEVQADCEKSRWHRSTHSCLLQPPKWPLKSHQFIPAHE